ncbi:MAG: hypothetical protein EP330_18650 [Deltaproteobacteria bacterium]|nr:MAG: hypothetical protein EP330_18650 [Deltaproteobacteria bacterium]
MNLAERLAEGVAALRDGRPAEAATALREVVDDPDFQEHPELADVRARAASLLAQALLATDEVGPADRYARMALDALDAFPDPEGKAQIDGLRKEIMGRALELRRKSDQKTRRQRLLALPVDELLAAAADDAEKARLLIERATAESEAERIPQAIRLANQARHLADEAHALKEQVLTRLLVAQLDEAQRLPALRSAYQLALAAGETGLITGVARTAEQVGVPHADVDRSS